MKTLKSSRLFDALDKLKEYDEYCCKKLPSIKKAPAL